MSTNDGGPAFPTAWESIHGGTGMTLRQWYKGQALVGLLSGPQFEDAATMVEGARACGMTTAQYTVAMASELADAMFAEDKREEKS